MRWRHEQENHGEDHEPAGPKSSEWHKQETLWLRLDRVERENRPLNCSRSYIYAHLHTHSHNNNSEERERKEGRRASILGHTIIRLSKSKVGEKKSLESRQERKDVFPTGKGWFKSLQTSSQKAQKTEGNGIAFFKMSTENCQPRILYPVKTAF